MSCVIIAYWDKYRNVMWARADGNIHPDESMMFSRMEDYVANGNTTEILEVLYHPEGEDHDKIRDHRLNRIKYWRTTLREQGYDIK